MPSFESSGSSCQVSVGLSSVKACMTSCLDSVAQMTIVPFCPLPSIRSSSLAVGRAMVGARRFVVRGVKGGGSMSPPVSSYMGSRGKKLQLDKVSPVAGDKRPVAYRLDTYRRCDFPQL